MRIWTKFAIFVVYVNDDFIGYDTFTGKSYVSIDLKEAEIVDIKYFKCYIDNGKPIMELIKEGD